MRLCHVAGLSLALVTAQLAAKPALQPAQTIAAAVADSAHRSPDNVKIDEGRKPAQVLQFLGVKPGMKVLDLFGANAYCAEIKEPIVGAKGQVTFWAPIQ